MAESENFDNPFDQADLVQTELRELMEQAVGSTLPGGGLTPSLLVHQVVRDLVERRIVNPADRAGVLAEGAATARKLMVERARCHGGAQPDEASDSCERSRRLLDLKSVPVDILDLDDALEKLGEERPDALKVVEMRFFGGLTFDEIAAQLNASPHTVDLDWRFGRAWLYRFLSLRSDNAHKHN